MKEHFISRYNEYLLSSGKILEKDDNNNNTRLQTKVWNFALEKVRNYSPKSSFFIFDPKDVESKHENWERHLPRVKPYFSVKSNNCQILLEKLAELGVGFDCVSEGEICQILKLNLPNLNSEVIFANPIKTQTQLALLRKLQIDIMTVDNEDELINISQNFPSAKLLLRLRVDDSISIQPFGDKYGAEKGSIRRLLGLAKFFELQVVGTSFHVGCRASELEAFAIAIRECHEVWSIAKIEFDYDFSILNIGGGFPGSDWHTGSDSMFEQIAAAINQELESSFPQSIYPDLEIIAEPGTYYCSSAFSLAAQVTGRRIDYESTRIGNGGGPYYHYYLNDGVFASFFGPLWGYPVGTYELPFRPLREGLAEVSNADLKMSTIWGQTLASLDVVVKDVEVPELWIGDWILFKDVGDYSLSMGTKFCGFQPTDTVYVTE